MKVRRGRKDEE